MKRAKVDLTSDEITLIVRGGLVSRQFDGLVVEVYFEDESFPDEESGIANDMTI